MKPNEDRFAPAMGIADAVLVEGYVLYPYRADTTKNRYRWQLGVLAPKEWSIADGGDPWSMETQLLVAGESPSLEGRLRYFSIVDRKVEELSGTDFRPCEMLELDGREIVAWEEGELRQLDFLFGECSEIVFGVADAQRIEIATRAGATVGRIVRTTKALSCAILTTMVRIGSIANEPLWRATVRIENRTPWAATKASRAEVMRASCASTHILLAVTNGRFLSLQDPPSGAEIAAQGCKAGGAWPVLAGADGGSDLALCLPLILEDHPRIAPESTGDFCDAAEIDELLAIRTRTLTDREKARVRGTDARGAAILARADAMSPSTLEDLHGTIRDRRPLGLFSVGNRVRLCLENGKRRTDVQDIIYSGCSATIHELKTDVDGREYLAVIIDDDPAAELHLVNGRYRYYYPDEVELLPGGTAV